MIEVIDPHILAIAAWNTYLVERQKIILRQRCDIHIRDHKELRMALDLYDFAIECCLWPKTYDEMDNRKKRGG